MHFTLSMFAMLRAPSYVKVLFHHLSYMRYLRSIHHPLHDLLTQSPSNAVGENIELSHRLLGQHTSHDSRRTNIDLLSHAYSHLGILMRHGMAMHVDLQDSIKGIKGSRRYEFKENDARVDGAAEFLHNLVAGMEEETWEHYHMPYKPPKKRGRKRKRREADDDEDEKEEDINWIDGTYSSLNLKSRETELDRTEIHPVPVSIERNWRGYLEKMCRAHFSAVESTWECKLSDPEVEKFREKFPNYC
jgi:hypothetical protein